MNRKESPQSPTANGPGQVPAPPSGEESEPTWSPTQEDISNREIRNPDLSEEEPEDDGPNQETGDGTSD
jgi:hypothetical protein